MFFCELHDGGEFFGHFRVFETDLALENLAEGAVQCNIVTLLIDIITNLHSLLSIVNIHLIDSTNTALAHASRHYRCMTRHAASGGQYTI